jgi:hypothetical protein
MENTVDESHLILRQIYPIDTTPNGVQICLALDPSANFAPVLAFCCNGRSPVVKLDFAAFQELVKKADCVYYLRGIGREPVHMQLSPSININLRQIIRKRYVIIGQDLDETFLPSDKPTTVEKAISMGARTWDYIHAMLPLFQLIFQQLGTNVAQVQETFDSIVTHVNDRFFPTIKKPYPEEFDDFMQDLVPADVFETAEDLQNPLKTRAFYEIRQYAQLEIDHTYKSFC